MLEDVCVCWRLCVCNCLLEVCVFICACMPRAPVNSGLRDAGKGLGHSSAVPSFDLLCGRFRMRCSTGRSRRRSGGSRT